jgi:hypothetical protein
MGLNLKEFFLFDSLIPAFSQREKERMCKS